MLRIAKIIADRGECSRRKAEELISLGQVKVNGIFIDSPNVKFEANVVIEVKGRILNPMMLPKIWSYHKPLGLIVTHSDPQNRPTIFENLKDLPRVISIGRLDLNSEGLLLLTNNGDLARLMELPATKLLRTYKVRAYGNFNIRDLKKVEKGIDIEGITYRAVSINLVQKSAMNNWFEVVLREGKNREIRRIFEFFRLSVNRLIRIGYGPFELKDLKAGRWREEQYNDFKNFL